MRPYLQFLLTLTGLSCLILLAACGPGGGSGSDNGDSSQSELFGEAGETLTFQEFIDAVLAKGEGVYRTDSEIDLVRLNRSSDIRTSTRNSRRLGRAVGAVVVVTGNELPAVKACDILDALPTPVTEDMFSQAAGLCPGHTVTNRFFRDQERLGHALFCDQVPVKETWISKLSSNTSLSLGQHSLNSTLYDDVGDATIQCGLIDDSYTLIEASQEGQPDQEYNTWSLSYQASYLPDQNLLVSATFSGDPVAEEYSVTDELVEVQEGGSGNKVYIRLSSVGFSSGSSPVTLFGESGVVNVQSVGTYNAQGTFDITFPSPVVTIEGSFSFSLD